MTFTDIAREILLPFGKKRHTGGNWEPTEAVQEALAQLEQAHKEAVRKELLRLNAQVPDSGNIGKWLGEYLESRLAQLTEGENNG